MLPPGDDEEHWNHTEDPRPRITRLVYEGPLLHIIRTEHPHGLVLKGEIDASVHGPLLEALADALNDTGDAPMRVNCAGLDFIDLSAFSLMVRELARRGLWGPIILDYLPEVMRSFMEKPGWPTLPHVMPGLRRAA